MAKKPSKGAARDGASSRPQRQASKNPSLYLPEEDSDLLEEIKDAVEYLKYTASAKTKDPDEKQALRATNRSRLMRDALKTHIEALRKKYHNGKRFPQRATDALEPGRPADN